jgi:hypothetical protein
MHRKVVVCGLRRVLCGVSCGSDSPLIGRFGLPSSAPVERTIDCLDSKVRKSHQSVPDAVSTVDTSGRNL